MTQFGAKLGCGMAKYLNAEVVNVAIVRTFIHISSWDVSMYTLLWL